MKRWVKKVHFVGIGGIGMSGIAEVLLNLGFEVSGSDISEGPTVARLRELGGEVFIGHAAENLDDADVVVTSSAVGPENPEVVAARYEGVPVIPRAAMLAELMRMKWGIAVAGSHGKTTTTSMVASVLSQAGLDPTAVIGGKLNIFGGSNAKLGQGEWMVAEADESDGSFLHLAPTVVVVTNIDREHMDHYADMDDLYETFLRFMNSVPFYGLVVCCVDDPALRALIPRIERRVVTYGVSGDADIRAVRLSCQGLGCGFTAVHQGRTLGEVRLGLPGMHNAINALAALAVAFELDVPFEKAARGLDGFTGVARRFELKGEVGGIMIVDDYGHHPTEIKATLEAAAGISGQAERGEGARLICVFQPHRYTRTRDLWADFVASFDAPDLLVVCDIYEASEKPIPGVTSELLCKEIKERRSGKGQKTWCIPKVEDVAPMLLDEARKGDVVLTLGAGSVYNAGAELIRLLGEK